MRLIGNVIWLAFGGIWMALGWFISGICMAIIFIGIPWARACFVMGKFSLWPFGREAISRKELTGEADLGTSGWGILANILWLPLGAFLAIGHVLSGVITCCTIIGIPFGIQHFKLAGMSLFPVGKTVVTKEVAQEARRRNATAAVDAARGIDTTPEPSSTQQDQPLT